MNNVDVSVIIPAHNAADYIDRAVESVRCQTGLDWEIIIVENGSMDDTYDRCLKYVNKDNRIKVIQSEKGVSNARNKGLDNAIGRWICFLDADDYLYADAFKEISSIKKIEEVKFVHFGHNSGLNKNKGDTAIYEKPEEFLSFRCSMLKNPTQYMTVWGQLFDREILNDNGIRFSSDLILAEDSDFTFRYLQCVDSALEMKSELYHYSKDNQSTVRSYNPDTAQMYIKAIEHTLEYVKKDCDEIKKAYSQYILIHLLLILVHDTFNLSNLASYKQKCKNMKDLLDVNCFKNALSKIKISECKSLRMMPIFCLKLHMNFAAILMIRIRVCQNSR